MKRKLAAFIILICIFSSLNGCVYSHNYDREGKEMSESQVYEKVDEIIDRIKNGFD